MAQSMDLPSIRLTDELEAPPLSLRQLFIRRFRRHTMAMVGVVVTHGTMRKIWKHFWVKCYALM